MKKWLASRTNLTGKKIAWGCNGKIFIDNTVMSGRLGEFQLYGRETGQYLGQLTEWADEDYEETAWRLNEFYDRTKKLLAEFYDSHEAINIEYIPDPPKLRLVE